MWWTSMNRAHTNGFTLECSCIQHVFIWVVNMKGFYELFNSKALRNLLFSPLKLHGQTVIQTDQTNRQSYRRTDRQTRQSYRQTVILTYWQTDRLTGRHTSMYIINLLLLYYIWNSPSTHTNQPKSKHSYIITRTCYLEFSMGGC